MFVFVTGVWIPPPVEFGVRICSDMHFWGSCGVLKVAMAQLEMPAGYSDICFWYACLGTCLPLLLATSHFYLAQFWCSCGDGFFPKLFFLQWWVHAYHFGHAVSKRAGAVAGAGIIQLENVFFFKVWGRRMSPRLFLPLLGWNCAWQLEPLDPEKFKNKAGKIPHPD